MFVKLKQLIGLPVVTRSGARLGRLADCLADTTSQSIIQYEVKSGWIAGDKLLIKRDQIISIEADKIIVEDAAAPQKATPAAAAPVATAPAAGSFTTIVQNDRS